MKKILLSIVLFSFSAHINAGTFAITKKSGGGKGDACQAVICMAGLVQGAGKVSECSSTYSDYFDIRVFKKGKFKPNRTYNKRLSFLNQCPQGGIWNKKINNKFGRLFSF